MLSLRNNLILILCNPAHDPPPVPVWVKIRAEPGVYLNAISTMDGENGFIV